MGIAVVIIGLSIRFWALIKAILLLKNKQDWRTYVLTVIVAFSFAHIPIATQFSLYEWQMIPWHFLATFLVYSLLVLFAAQFTSYYVEVSNSKHKTLKQFMAVFDQFMKTAPLGCFIIQNGKIVYANEAACNLTGYSSDEISDFPFFKLAAPNREDQLRALSTFESESSASWQDQIQIKAKNNTLISGHATFGSVEYNGAPAVAGTFQDITNYLEAETSLKETEKRLRLALDAANLAVWDFNTETEKVVLNLPQQLDGLFDTSSPLPLDKIEEQILPEDYGVMREALDHAIEQGVRFQHDFRMMDGTGTPKWWSMEGKSFEQEGSAALRVVGTSKYIHEQKIAEQHIKEQEERLRLAAEIAGIQVWEWDVSSKNVKHESGAANPTCRQVKDFEHFDTLLHPDHRERVMDAIDRTLKNGDKYEEEFLLRAPSGAYRWQLSIGKLILDTDGNPARLIGAAIDTTERRQKEELIQFHSDLLSRIDEAIVAQNLKGEVIYFNKAAERMLGETDNEDFTQALNLQIPQEHRIINNSRIMDRLHAGQSWSGSFTVYNFNGDAIPTHLTISPINDEDDQFNGFIGVATDMTEYHDIQQKLEMNEERLRMAMEAANIVVWDVNTDTKTVYREVPEAIQTFPKNALRTIDALRKHLHPDEADWFNKKAVERLKKGSGFSIEHRFLDPDGTYQWWHTQAKPVAFNNAHPNRVIGASQLITARKLAETQVQQQFHQLQAIYNVVDIASQAEDLQSICHAAAASLKLALGAHALGIISFGALGNECEFLFTDNLSLSIQDILITHCDLTSEKTNERPSILGKIDTSLPAKYKPDLFLEEGIKAICFSPLTSQYKVIGKVVVCYPSPIENTDEHQELAKRIADHISLAMEKHWDQKALRESEAQNKAILKALPDMVFKVDRQGIYQEVAQALDHHILFKPTEANVGFRLQDIMPAPLASLALSKIKTTLDTNEVQLLEYPATIGPTKRYFEARFSKCTADQVLIIVRDLTERRTLQQTIADTSARQQRRIGQDLHDQLGQLLTGIGFRVAGLKQQLLTTNKEDAEDAAEISTLVEQAIAQTRLLAEGLNPITLDVHGLQAGLERLALNTAKLYGLSCTFKNNAPEVQFDEEIAVQVYRITQEAVNNAIKHARSDSISISLQEIDDKIELRIEDNGIGIQTDTKSYEGHGLPIMNYRASMIGAAFDVTPIATGGTRVSCLFNKESDWHTHELLAYPDISQGPPIN